MKYALILGAAVSTLALTASAQPAPPAPPTPPAAPHIMMMHGPGMELNVDANHDGWISRAEAGAAADRMFDHMDTNHDGRLTPDDRPMWHGGGDHVMAMPEDGNCQTNSTGEGNERRVTVICRGEGGPGQHAGLPAPDDPHCQTTTEDQGPGQRRVTVTCTDDDAHADNGSAGHQVERRVVVTRNGDTTTQVEHGETRSETRVIIRNDEDAEAPEAPTPPGAPAPPRAPHPPHAPMLMMLFANSEEADTNHDGALSREEFRAQQLRFFDASDANHDGKIRFEPPPMPPEMPAPPAPPEAPTPPAPPAPHH
ncbi:MAG: hypothetical protein QM759_15795 [Terricaulis sp.]